MISGLNRTFSGGEQIFDDARHAFADYLDNAGKPAMADFFRKANFIRSYGKKKIVYEQFEPGWQRPSEQPTVAISRPFPDHSESVRQSFDADNKSHEVVMNFRTLVHRNEHPYPESLHNIRVIAVMPNLSSAQQLHDSLVSEGAASEHEKPTRSSRRGRPRRFATAREGLIQQIPHALGDWDEANGPDPRLVLADFLEDERSGNKHLMPETAQAIRYGVHFNQNYPFEENHPFYAQFHKMSLPGKEETFMSDQANNPHGVSVHVHLKKPVGEPRVARVILFHDGDPKGPLITDYNTKDMNHVARLVREHEPFLRFKTDQFKKILPELKEEPRRMQRRYSDDPHLDRLTAAVWHARSGGDASHLHGLDPWQQTHLTNAAAVLAGKRPRAMLSRAFLATPLGLHAHRALLASDAQYSDHPDERFVTVTAKPRIKMSRSYARLTLGQPKHWRSFTGGSGFEHDYFDEAGNKAGVIRLQPRDSSLHVHWMGPTDKAAGEVSHTHGIEAMRSLLPQIQQHYPQAQFLTGIRSGGARSGAPERVVFPLKKRFARPAIRQHGTLAPEQIYTPQELNRIQSFKKDTRNEYEKLINQSMADRPGSLPTKNELMNLAQLGEAAKGEYNASFQTLRKMLGDQMAWAFIAINSILSPQSKWEEHTLGAIRLLGMWNDRGRPVIDKQVNRLIQDWFDFKLPSTAKKAKPGDEARAYKMLEVIKNSNGKINPEGPKVSKLRFALKNFGVLQDLTPEWMKKSGYGKTVDFMMAFAKAPHTPIDTHMIKLYLPWSAPRVFQAAAGGTEIAARLLEAQQQVIKHDQKSLAYKHALHQAAADLGWEPREVQEAVWTSVCAIAAAKHLGFHDNEILDFLDHQSMRQGWDLHQVLFSPEVKDDLLRSGAKPLALKTIGEQAATGSHRPAAKLTGSIGVSDPDAIANVARRIPPSDTANQPLYRAIGAKLRSDRPELAAEQMSRHYARRPAGKTYDDLAAFLGRKEKRRISPNKIVYKDRLGDIHVRLHQTDVVTAHPDGTYTIRTGGWNTPTTRRTIADFSPARVYSERNVPKHRGEVVFDGMRILPTGETLTGVSDNSEETQDLLRNYERQNSPYRGVYPTVDLREALREHITRLTGHEYTRPAEPEPEPAPAPRPQRQPRQPRTPRPRPAPPEPPDDPNRRIPRDLRPAPEPEEYPQWFPPNQGEIVRDEPPARRMPSRNPNRQDPGRGVKPLPRPRPMPMQRRYAAADQQSFGDAMGVAGSKNQNVKNLVAKDITTSLGLLPAVSADAVHQTRSGSKPTMAIQIEGGDNEKVNYAGAWYSLLTRQPGSVVFHAGPGEDILHSFSTKEPIDQIGGMLDRIGATDRTVVPKSGSWDIYLFDKQGRIGSGLQQIAQSLGLKIKSYRGHGSFLGGGDNWRENLRRVIRSYEQKVLASQPQQA